MTPLHYTDGIEVALRPILALRIPMFDGRDCDCGRVHFPGHAPIQQHAHRLLGQRVLLLWLDWPQGIVTFRRAP